MRSLSTGMILLRLAPWGVGELLSHRVGGDLNAVFDARGTTPAVPFLPQKNVDANTVAPDRDFRRASHDRTCESRRVRE